jgi:hypothetical protein
LYRQPLAADRLVRLELVLLRNLGRDRRTASTHLAPLIRSGPAALAAPPPLPRPKRPARELTA